MVIVRKDLLAKFAEVYPDSRGSLSAWQMEVERARWSNPAHLKLTYPSASLVGKDNVVFNIRGNNYRLHARVNYAANLVLVVRVGTHKEYDGWTY